MQKITIVPYNLICEKQAFITFGLEHKNLLQFPLIELEEEISYTERNEDVLSLTENYLKTILSNYLDVRVRYIDEFYVESDKSLTLLYEIQMNHTNSYIITQSSKLWFATIHEIVNTGKFCNFDIDESVGKQVKMNIDYFEDLWDVIPSVYYDGGNMKKMLFESLFGTSKRDENDGKGEVHRFYDFFQAYDRAILDGQSKMAGVLRYVLFEDVTSDNLVVSDFESFMPLTLHPVSSLDSC